MKEHSAFKRYHFIDVLYPKNQSLIRCKSSAGDEIDLEEAERSPLSPDFSLLKRESKKYGDNSDPKNDS
ncbi:hypothetical protein NST33_06235 [Paenibacillus sp. FSL L8-0435]|uniref:hypothetical protein n=1 Tax=Paenibacillus TaxID=44249 RepID=UPI001C8CFFC6|nr:hypothetical protein [Paenibacillus xylanexedens]MBY0115014.1 hypothetical protein [Paenibacillus xylanexedens]